MKASEATSGLDLGRHDAVRVEADPSARPRIGVIAARFNAAIVDRLVDGALAYLTAQGVQGDRLVLVRVPGAWELPAAAMALARSEHVDAIVALGCVIRGATPHFEYVAGQCAAGIARVAEESSVPVAFGVLTTENIEQAIERSGTKAGNKGADAAMVALEMANLLRRLAG
jgi:6,7-dimethyl-8-ribityllumazine synthase